MASSVAFSFPIFSSKLTSFRLNTVLETPGKNLNLAAVFTRYQSKAIEMEEYDVVPSPLINNSVVTHQIPDNQIRFQYAMQNIREIMANKSTEGNQLEELIIIDTIQRLGLESYFEDEINAALHRHYIKFTTLKQTGDADLHEIALRFRLLRQQGYKVTADVLSKFEDNEGEFKQSCADLKGLVSLFEASKLSIEGENRLDEAGRFSEQVLKALLSLNVLEEPKGRIIEKTLRNPFNRSLARIVAPSTIQDLRIYIEFLHGLCHARGIEWVKDMEELAVIDFDMSQTSHRNEILRISRWGKEISVANELQFARIQPFKWYIWSLGCLPGPDMAEHRVELAKSVSFIYMIDDIFDVYGTLDELSLFTEAVNRWDDGDIYEELPDYMKVCFRALRDMVDDISHKTHVLYGWDPQGSLRKAWGDLCKSFLNEAKWLANDKLPNSEEYLKNGIISSGIPVVLMHAFFLMGREINKTSVDSFNHLPTIVSSAATIVRLWNDVGSDKIVNRDGNKDGSYIDCYMKEHNMSSAEGAKRHVNQMILDAWKDLNQECLSPTSPFSADFKASCLNFARMASIMYSFDKHQFLLDLQKQLNFSLKQTLNH